MEAKLNVNGFLSKANYPDHLVNEVFWPLLHRLTEEYRKTGMRKIVFLAGPPAAGKSTLTLFLEQLTREQQVKVQALGLDGFHYPAEYLNSHSTIRDGKTVLLKSIKGSPETYDTEHFGRILKHIDSCRRTGEEVRMRWPGYDRNLHDVVPDQYPITGEILLIEGNYLLLRDEPWRELSELADIRMFVRAEEETLRQRLINRKIRGGMDPKAAENWYHQTDERNIRKIIEDSQGWDIEIKPLMKE